MPQRTHQTAKLERGKHASPDQGVCVMELSSMLAGETFTDHPASVSIPLAAFLRAYNDMLDEPRRQDLYDYASRSVGTADGDAVERLRTRYMLEWAERRAERKGGWFPSVLRQRPPRWGRNHPEVVARYAIQTIGKVSEAVHGEVLALIDELIALGPSAGAERVPERVESPPAGVARPEQART